MSTEVTITVPNAIQTFPVGTVVGLYRGQVPNSGVPLPMGSAITTATVAGDGSLTFAGVLADQVSYWGASKIGGTWRFLSVTVDLTPSGTFDSTGLSVFDAPTRSTPRPIHNGPILWRCAGVPEHWGEGDLWIDQTSEVE